MSAGALGRTALPEVPPARDRSAADRLTAIERQHIEWLLREGGHRTEAAPGVLGLSRPALPEVPRTRHRAAAPSLNFCFRKFQFP